LTAPSNHRGWGSPGCRTAQADFGCKRRNQFVERAKDAERLANLAEQSRTDRLEAVRQAISNGTYYVSGEDIAQKLIELNTR
jgi:anti-sigma28 factor (negative regulator of flagellin synthesis)